MAVTQVPSKYVSRGGSQLLDSETFAKVILTSGAASLFYVHSGTGSDTNVGTAADAPFATLDAAIGACTADKGDVILVMPGHAENIADATTFLVDKAGISIIGLGNGRNRPVFTFTNTAGSIELDAANVLVQNLVFFSSVSAVVVGVNVDADNVTIDGCEWNYDASGDDFILMADIDAVNRTTIRNCLFRAEEAAGCTAAIRLDAAPDTTITGNTFLGRYTQTVSGTTGSAAASTGLVMTDNIIENTLTSTGTVVDMNDSTTGIIARNVMASGDSTTGIASLFDPGNCKNFLNYVCNAVDESGGLVPNTASG